MKIKEIINSDPQYENTVKDIFMMVNKLPNIKKYDFIATYENVDDKINIIHTDPSWATILKVIYWKLRYGR